MLNSKKIISSLLALSIVTASSAFVCTAETTFPSSMIYSANSEKSINWAYISVVGAGFSFDGSYGECTGSYELYSDRKAVMTITLMKSKDCNNWSAVESWSTTNYDYSPSSFIKTSSNTLTHGYYYLTHTQVQVLDSNDNVLETGNSESAISYYK